MIQTSTRFADLPKELNYRTAFEEFPAECERLMVSNDAQVVCEVGAGRSPLLEIADVMRLGIDYTIMDISPNELLQAPPGYRTLCLDICSDLVEEVGERFDFVLSKYVAEHVRSGEAMHRNVYAMLKPGGIAFHFFPTLYHPAFMANYLLPEIVSRPLVRRFRQHNLKFPARYSKCFGPTRRMRDFLLGVGYEIIHYRAFYGSGYFKKLPVLGLLDGALSSWAAHRRNPFLTSFVYLVLRKPR
jgi:SAM-dependent methyltransferase